MTIFDVLIMIALSLIAGGALALILLFIVLYHYWRK